MSVSATTVAVRTPTSPRPLRRGDRSRESVSTPRGVLAVLNWVRAERVRDVWEARPHPPRTTRARPGWAVAGAGAVFLIAYGLQAVSAFMLYLSPAASADRASESTTMIHDAIGGQLVLLFVAAVVAGGIVLATMPRGLRLRDYQRKIPGQRGGAALTAAGVMVASLVGAVLAWVVGVASMNTALPAGATLRQGIGQAVLAGIGEEIFVLVLPYTALRLVRLPARDGVRRGLPLTVVVAVCVALRMSYHVYYGPGIVSLLPWAVLTVLVFHRWRLLTPLVLTHIAYDSVLSVANHGLITTTEELTVLCAAAVVLLVVGATRVNFRSIVSREGSAAGVEPIAPQ